MEVRRVEVLVLTGPTLPVASDILDTAAPAGPAREQSGREPGGDRDVPAATTRGSDCSVEETGAEVAPQDQRNRHSVSQVEFWTRDTY